MTMRKEITEALNLFKIKQELEAKLLRINYLLEHHRIDVAQLDFNKLFLKYIENCDDAKNIRRELGDGKIIITRIVDVSETTLNVSFDIHKFSIHCGSYTRPKSLVVQKKDLNLLQL